MTALALKLREQHVRLGLKGPRAADLLLSHGIVVPTAPNTWTHSEEIFAADGMLAARLGAGEFFLEEGPAGATLKGISASLDERAPGGQPSGVYPVLREDWAFQIGGERVHDVLAQVCNVNFAALPPGFSSIDHDAHDRGSRCWSLPQGAINTGSGAIPTFGSVLGRVLGRGGNRMRR